MQSISLSDPERLATLLSEVETELGQVQPRIEALEAALDELQALKQTKQRLLTLKMSLSTLLETINTGATPTSALASASQPTPLALKAPTFMTAPDGLRDFHPDLAFQEADRVLKHKDSLNYEIFKAVVFQGGRATTEEIRTALAKGGIRLPKTGESVEEMGLSKISARANYLIRRGLLQPVDHGSYYSTVGWTTPEN